MSAPVPVADAAAGQRQILRDLAAEYGRQLRQILQVGELVKGSLSNRDALRQPGLPLRYSARPTPSCHGAFLERGRSNAHALAGCGSARPRPPPVRAVPPLAAGARRCGPAAPTDAARHRSTGTGLALASAPCRWPATCRPLGRPEAAWLRFVTVSRSRMQNCSRKPCWLCPWKAGGKTGCATPTACSTILNW